MAGTFLWGCGLGKLLGMKGSRRNRIALGMDYVVRTQGPRVAGWQVRLPQWHPAGPGSKLFSDTTYGSGDAALKAAREYRDTVFQGLAGPGHPRTHSTNTRSTSKAVGVSLSGKARPGCQTHWYWEAYWNDGAQTQLKKRFSVRRMGYLAAWEAAIAHRQLKTGKVFSEYVLAGARLACLRIWLESLSHEGVPLN